MTGKKEGRQLDKKSRVRDKKFEVAEAAKTLRQEEKLLGVGGIVQTFG